MNETRDRSGVWFLLHLGEANLAQDQVSKIIELAEEEYRHSGRDRGFALFIRQEGGLHCKTSLCFSPLAAKLAIRLGADPGPPPPRRGLEVLVGSSGAMDLLPGL